MFSNQSGCKSGLMCWALGPIKKLYNKENMKIISKGAFEAPRDCGQQRKILLAH